MTRGEAGGLAALPPDAVVLSAEGKHFTAGLDRARCAPPPQPRVLIQAARVADGWRRVSA